MGMPKKGSRAITVDEVDYRWRVRRNPTYSQGLTWSPMAVAVVLAHEPGSRLVVSLDQPHPSNWVGEPALPILPSTVAAAIRAALKAGWQPAQPGKPFEMRWTNTETEGVE